MDLEITGQDNEMQLLGNYITKNHRFRHAITKFKRRALIRDSFGYFRGEAFAQTGYLIHYSYCSIVIIYNIGIDTKRSM